MRAFDEHLASLDRTWVQRVLRKFAEDHPSHVHIESTNTESSSDVPMDGVEVAHDENVTIPPRPPPSAALIVRLPFPFLRVMRLPRVARVGPKGLGNLNPRTLALAKRP